MAEQKQNGEAQPVFKEGELVLFVRLNKGTNEFQCIFPDLFTALALHKLAGEYLDTQVQAMFRPQPHLTIPNVSLPTYSKIDRTRGI